MTNDKRLLYFAFGSNLLEQQRIDRLSEFGDLPSGERAVLNDYEICFHKIANSEPGFGFATINQSPNNSVQGLLIGLNNQQISRLDRSEGVNVNPPHYTKEEITVQTDDGMEHSAFTYVAHPSRIDSSLHPSIDYLQKVVFGAKENGLDQWYIETLESFRT